LLIQLERAKAALDDHGPIVFRNVQALATSVVDLPEHRDEMLT
jgi:hypothetical protein